MHWPCFLIALHTIFYKRTLFFLVKYHLTFFGSYFIRMTQITILTNMVRIQLPLMLSTKENLLALEKSSCTMETGVIRVQFHLSIVQTIRGSRIQLYLYCMSDISDLWYGSYSLGPSSANSPQLHKLEISICPVWRSNSPYKLKLKP